MNVCDGETTNLSFEEPPRYIRIDNRRNPTINVNEENIDNCFENCGTTYDVPLELIDLTVSGKITFLISGPDGLFRYVFNVLPLTDEECDGGGEPLLCIEAVPTNPTTSGGTDGQIVLTWEGGQAPFTLTFDGATSAVTSPHTVSGLSAGNYVWSIADDAGESCGATSVLIDPVDPLECNTALLSDPSCFGYDDGSVELSWTGGAEPFDVTFDGVTYVDVISPYTVTGLLAGSYDWTVAYADETCGGTETLTDPAQVFAYAGEDVDVTYGYMDETYNCATLTGSGSGGVAPLSYLWSTGETTASIEVCPGDSDATYTLTVTDANGCSATDDVTVVVENIICEAGESGEHKVYICHKELGNNPQTICVDVSSVESHLAHGDGLGMCDFDKSAILTPSNEPARYYNIMGVELRDKPAEGLYIEVKDGKATKKYIVN